ncbi:SDR family NAD(P)-dependent oxidoreductase [Nocardia cyriacigeorgica]|jgi:NAD(P)-dependent dehydrogenase (short-subunit alcohol dehydrogenase family)|uniref:SDR family NAD(P)-dependent oxidoreductase n=1 Tax=Nocardia cyriacigeorgica TaxID=135487 RepID=UPI00055EA571|nr:SDR family NAD(P)-dependent oxidoreductase [Nocardia cyriacigeorgica]AVH24108.1 short-chain dehydrogenase [Nocardia cyriacigeorgica]MBF6326365.1 SDR family NAD(P)-dependent oxidoreductase [Nocardia cyriacigeorgica]PPJ05560.1 short-chain dehydrogenase [Nocardia cyriacigeorgica]TLF59868.1 SDR family NAD(P)-dependent oxidoreductase [Nocardia cyriacigeorgica]
MESMVGLSSDRIVVVTGASRGAGKGIALALGETGATVYVTGRTRTEGEAPLPGTVFATADEITRRGGHGVPVVLDHRDDAQVEAFFAELRDQHGRLDILVNNALTVPDGLTDKGPFWEKPLTLLELLDVGMRSSYVSSYYAAPLLVANGGGLVVNTSSFGGTCYMHGPAYGAGKAAVDKMAHDMAVDFRPWNVAVVSIWMGLLTTERTLAGFAANPGAYEGLAATAESPEFTGRVIDALARDPELMKRSGQVLVGAEIAQELGVSDIEGQCPPSHRPFLGDPPVYSDAVID